MLEDRPLSVIRARAGQAPFMQKNVPEGHTAMGGDVGIWAEASKREVHYALCNDRRTLLWFANQRAIEYHPALAAHGPARPYHPPDPRPRPARGLGLLDRRPRRAPRPPGPRRPRARGRGQDERREGRPRVRPGRPRGADGGHRGRDPRHRGAHRASRSHASRRRPSSRRTAAARCSSTRRGSAAPRSPPRTAPGSGPACPSPSRWDGTTSTRSRRRTSRSARRPPASATTTRGPSTCPRPSTSPTTSIAEGHEIPVARVQAMHEGKRRRPARDGS